MSIAEDTAAYAGEGRWGGRAVRGGVGAGRALEVAFVPFTCRNLFSITHEISTGGGEESPVGLESILSH